MGAITGDPDQQLGTDMSEVEIAGAQPGLKQFGRLPEDVDVLPGGARRCVAHVKASNPTDPGGRCMKAAKHMMTVCRAHGGAAPQTVNKARLRLLELVDPAVAKLARVLASGDDGDALRAAENILDRAGLPRKSEVDVEASRQVLVERIERLRDRLTDDDEDDTILDAELVDE